MYRARGSLLNLKAILAEKEAKDALYQQPNYSKKDRTAAKTVLTRLMSARNDLASVTHIIDEVNET